ncbi:MAG: hypothetical protein HQ564_02880 [Candidatus Saganbacteria bacterium]|nr:hypothetical protein [Candidatus Saganbacteria bacterium]
MSNLNIYSITSLICTFYLVSLAIGVYLNKKSATTRAFLLVMFSTAFWQLFTFLTITANNPIRAEMFTKAAYLGAVFIPVTILHLTVSFLNIEKMKRIVFLFYLLAIFVFIPATLFNLLISGINIFPWGYWFRAAAYHPIYVLYLSGLIGFSLFLLYKNFRGSREPMRSKIFFLLVAFTVAYGGAIDIIPDYGINIPPLGSIPVIVCLTIIAYAITKNRLMDVKIIINRMMAYFVICLIYTLLGTFSAFIFYLLSFNEFNVAAASFFIILLLSAGVLFHPLRLHLQTTPDRFLFRKKYEYAEAIKELGEECSSVIEADKLIELFAKRIEETTKTSGIKIHSVE